jgi:sugar phosphate isomerase/epimerase
MILNLQNLDQQRYEILLNETDKTLVDFEMDLYWVVRAGHDPLQLFKEHQDVSKCGMLKIWINPDWNAEIGSGSINFKAIFLQS